MRLAVVVSVRKVRGGLRSKNPKIPMRRMMFSA
jgi:hypothetical protein